MSVTVELVHAVSTLFMAAVIWFVQVVHYPLFQRVGAEAFAAYERAHVERITWIVMPAMTAELLSAVALLALGSSILTHTEAVVGLALIGVIWASTGLVQVPLHGRLGAGLDPSVVGQLVASNWVRTLAWTARAALVCLALSRALGRG